MQAGKQRGTMSFSGATALWDPVSNLQPRWTPLHYASQFGYLKIVETLLDAKAEAAPKELTCSTPLSLATMENQAGLPLVLFCLRTYVVPQSFGHLSGIIIE